MVFEGIEAVRRQIREVRSRVLSTIDAFRPRILIKEPLSTLLPQAEVGVNAEALLERIQNRIQELRMGVGMQRSGAESEASGLVIAKGKKGKRGVLY